MYVDFKSTIWDRITINDDIKDEVLALVKSGKIVDANDFYEHFQETDFEYELLLDTSESLPPEENEGFPTIEVHTDENYLNDEIIWNNGRQEEEK